MSKRRKVAPLQLRKTEVDGSSLVFDVLNDVFGDIEDKKANVEREHSEFNDLPEFIDLDDWDISLKLQSASSQKNGKSQLSSNHIEKMKDPFMNYKTVATPEETKKDTNIINKVEISVLKSNSTKNDSLNTFTKNEISSSRKTCIVPDLHSTQKKVQPAFDGESLPGNVKNNGYKMMFQSKEHDEDSILRLRFLKRILPASRIKEVNSSMQYVHLASALKYSESKTWFTAGVVTDYTPMRSNSGSRIDITDLAQDPYTIRVLLFDSAFSSHAGKLTPGAIVCVISPGKGKPYNGKEPLIVNNEDQLLLAGTSRDFGKCGARKKAGGLCGAVVNLNICRFCSYHAMSEYKQKNMGKGIREALGVGIGAQMNKPSMHGKSKLAIQSGKRNIVQVNKDRAILDKLASSSVSIKSTPNNSAIPRTILINNEKTTPCAKRKLDAVDRDESPAGVFSTSIGNSFVRGTGDVGFGQPNTPKINKQMSLAKKRAIAFAQNAGGISPALKKPKDSKESEANAIDPKSVITPEFIALMTAKSSNPALLEETERRQRDARFDRLNVMEEVTEKLVKTHEITVRVVRCLVCKKNFHKMPLDCLQKKHNCRIVQGTKRFFECVNCHYRMSTIERLPLTECGKCGSCNWKRAGMAADRVCRNLHQLSLRGIEEKFMGSIVTDPNLSLLVPDDK